MDAHDASIKKYTEQLAQDPKSRVFVPLADLYRQLGRYDEAILVAQEGVKLNPSYVSGKISLARAHFENGEIDPAFELLEGVLATSPDNLLANRIFAEIAVQKNDPERAKGALNHVLSIEPGDKRSRDLLDKIASGAKSTPVRTATLAELYRTQGHHKEALSIYKELLAKDPNNRQVAESVAGLEELIAPKPISTPSIEASSASPKELPLFNMYEKLLDRIAQRRRSL